MRRVAGLIFVLGCGGTTTGKGADAPLQVGADAPLQTDAPIVVVDGPAGGGDAGCVKDLTALALAPADSEVTLDGTTAAPIAFTATGTFTGGAMAAVSPSALGWSVSRADDTPPGTMAGNVLAPNPAAGGTVTVTATDGCVTGSTTVRFTLATTIGTPTGDWSGTPTTSGAPLLVYPSDQTRFPRNIYRTLFQWRTAGLAQFRLAFVGPGSTVTVYTDGVHPLCAGKTPAAGCWEAEIDAWSAIAGSNAGQTVTVTLDGRDAAGAIHRAAPIAIGFSKRDVIGAIFYWSTTSAGIRRANIADATPEDYITGKPGTVYGDGTKVKCVACHVVSRDGKYLAAPTQTSVSNALTVMTVTNDPPPALGATVMNTMGHGFGTISPDDAYLVAAWGGKMWQLDRVTGTKLVDLPLGALKATHPDWSPDGAQLAFATGSGDAPNPAGIDLLGYGGGTTWTGPPSTLVPAGGKANLFPAFSPDGKWIAFSRGKGGHDDLTAQLFVVRVESGATPIELVNANRVVSNQLGDGQNEQNQPTWAPPGDLSWIAFNSLREYGVVAPHGTQQIWVAAVDLTRGGDPSYPAFRLQFQGLDEDNHRAFWTRDVRQSTPPPDAGPPPADAGACLPPQAPCDPVADTCCTEPSGRYVCDTFDDGVTYSCVVLIP